MSRIEAGQLLWTPSPERLARSHLTRYLRFLEERGRQFADYEALWRWSVEDIEGFWQSIVEFCGVQFTRPATSVLGRREMPGAEWFPGATLNYAEHAVGGHDDELAVIAYSQTRDRVELTWAQLRDQVARARAGLARLGVGRDDRVVAYLPNIPETVVAFLATVSLGAIWASCAPEFGARSVVDRFGQIEPTVLLTVAGYGYGSKDIDRRAQVAEI